MRGFGLFYLDFLAFHSDRMMPMSTMHPLAMSR